MDTQGFPRRDAGWRGDDGADAPLRRLNSRARAGFNRTFLAAAAPAESQEQTPEPRFDPAVVGPLLAAAIAAPQIMSGPPIFLDEDED